MNAVTCGIPGVYLIEPRIHSDDRGSFFEAWREGMLADIGMPRFVQDNQSFSKSGVLRGLHYQLGHPQAKLVRVLSGEIFDVAVDLRRGSPTFSKWVGYRLTAESRQAIFIPEGFAHGFLVLSWTAEVLYKTSDFYAPAEERGLRWDSPEIGISWPTDELEKPILSAKDAAYPTLSEIKEKNLPETKVLIS